MTAYRDLVRHSQRQVKASVKASAPEWLIGYAESSIRKANFFHARRRSLTCPLRSRAVNELLQLDDVLSHYLRSVTRQ